LVEDTRNSVVRYERTLLNLNPIYKSCGGQCRTLRGEELSTINYPLSRKGSETLIYQDCTPSFWRCLL